MVRLQKFLAEAGIASRRGAEEIIRRGCVCVNGEVVTRMGTQVDPETDEVTVDGREVRIQRRIYLALNKPVDVVCTRHDEQSRRTVQDLLPKEWASRVYPVGRLDRETEGLLLLTNDGEFCLRMTHPRYGVVKQYVATVTGRVGPELVAQLRKGIYDAGQRLRAHAARILSTNNSRSVLALDLAEGRNREVRRLLAGLHYHVEHLCRVQIGPIRLGELPSGRWRVLTTTEIKSLMDAAAQGGTRGRPPEPPEEIAEAAATSKVRAPATTTTRTQVTASAAPSVLAPVPASAARVPKVRVGARRAKAGAPLRSRTGKRPRPRT